MTTATTDDAEIAGRVYQRTDEYRNIGTASNNMVGGDGNDITISGHGNNELDVLQANAIENIASCAYSTGL